jgi:nitrate/nitrite-specific signal transduction histidine kinase
MLRYRNGRSTKMAGIVVLVVFLSVVMVLVGAWLLQVMQQVTDSANRNT